MVVAERLFRPIAIVQPECAVGKVIPHSTPVGWKSAHEVGFAFTKTLMLPMSSDVIVTVVPVASVEIGTTRRDGRKMPCTTLVEVADAEGVSVVEVKGRTVRVPVIAAFGTRAGFPPWAVAKLGYLMSELGGIIGAPARCREARGAPTWPRPP